MQKFVLVTGDVVSDCHLYGAVESAATSSRRSGAVYTQQPGGMALTHRLLESSLRAAASSHEPALGVLTDNLVETLPPALRSFGVWTPHPKKRQDSKEQVWRIDQDFGYGPGDPMDAHGGLALNPALPTAPALTVIDDGAILFRHRRASGLWPEISATSNSYYLLKTTYPLCRSDLWDKLKAVKERLVVVVSAADLRREDIQINSHLSWEQAAEHTLAAFYKDPVAKGLSCAAHVIVSFRSAGALLISFNKGDVTGCKLIFDQLALEEDFDRDFHGTVYGFQTCLTAAIAHHLVAPIPRKDGSVPDPFADPTAMADCLQRGIVAGLTARRTLMESGHGPVGAEEPGFPIETVAGKIAAGGGEFVTAEVPLPYSVNAGSRWSFLSRAEGAASAAGEVPLVGLGILTARYGWKAALSHVPVLQKGDLLSVDRNEIESLRTLDALIRAYDAKPQKRPLSIAVFGPPGAGKSFGVKALAKAILGDKVPVPEFNLSQFGGPEGLIGALHQVRDAVLRGSTPVVFWDEFDSERNRWLQYLLAPMQDGTFQEGQITHPIGKAIFIFAGGTSATIDQFSITEPKKPLQEELEKLDETEGKKLQAEYEESQKLYVEFKRVKGPDFVSRLHGFLNVQGPNRQSDEDITWPVRRALLLRSIIGAKDGEILDIDPGLLHALLRVPEYRHGSRSFEKIVTSLKEGQKHGRLHRSALPPAPLLNRDTDAAKFLELLTHGDSFKTQKNLEAIAAAIHFNFLAAAERSKITQAGVAPAEPWKIHPSIEMEYDRLDSDKKEANRAAAQRIPDLLALIDFAVKPLQQGDDASWKETLSTAINKHLDRLALAEHLGWSEERKASGWIFGPERKEELKQHNLLVTWGELSASDQDKDRSTVLSISDILEMAGYKAEPIPLSF